MKAERIRRAGIGNAPPSGSVALVSLISPFALLAAQSNQPASFGNIDNRLKELAKRLNLQRGIVPSLMGAWRVPANTDINSAILKSLMDDNQELLPTASYLRSEIFRPEFNKRLAKTWDQVVMNSMEGLLRLGIKEAEVPEFIKHIVGDDEDRRYFALGVLAQSGHLPAILESGKIEEKIDSDTTVGALVAFWSDGIIDGVTDALDNGGWQAKVGILRFVKAAAAQHSTPELLEMLVEKAKGEGDSDVQTCYSWTVGEVIRHLGFDAAKFVLENIRDNYNLGGNQANFMLNAALRFQGSAEEKAELLKVLDSYDTTDNDALRSIGRVRSTLSGSRPQPNDWLFTGGYGRGVDIYETGECVVPQLVLESMAPSEGSVPYSAIGVLNTLSFNNIAVKSMIASGVNAVYPDSLSIYKNWLLGTDFDNNSKPALAAVLLLTEAEHSVSPVLLRCYLGAEAGGPIPEEEGVLGELLAYYDQYRLKETATHLLCNGSNELRKLAAHYFHNKLKFNDNDDMAKALFKTGVSIASGGAELPEPSTLLRIVAGEAVDSNVLAQLVLASEGEELDFVWSTLHTWVVGADIEPARSFVRLRDVWAAAPLLLVQNTILTLLQKSSWVQKEVGSTAAGTAGARVLDGDQGAKIRALLEKHINDSDSDVERESKAACRALGIEFVEVNPETLRRNIINGDGEEFDAWVDRLVNYYDEADNVSELRTLSRSKALWSAVGTDVLENKWFTWASSSNWIHREIAGILAQVNGDVMLDSTSFPRAAEVVTELQRLVNDNDSDVTRESRLACDENGIEYTLD